MDGGEEIIPVKPVSYLVAWFLWNVHYIYNIYLAKQFKMVDECICERKMDTKIDPVFKKKHLQ